jgi:hypothetical protein
MLDSFLQTDLNHIAREFLTAAWDPLYFSKALEYMERAGLEFTGSFPVLRNYDEYSITPQFHDYFRNIRDWRAFETRKDFVNMSLLRYDVYRKGARNPKASHVGKFRGMNFGSFLRGREFRFKIEIPGFPVQNLESPVFEKLANAMEGASMSLDALLGRPEFDASPPEEIISSLEWLVATGQVAPMARAYSVSDGPSGNPIRLSRFNRAVLLGDLPNRRTPASLASWTGGGAISLPPRDALALLALNEAGVEGAEAWAGLWSVRNNPAGGDERDPRPLSEIIKGVAADSARIAGFGLSDPPRD